jgi:hypothetical protein
VTDVDSGTLDGPMVAAVEPAVGEAEVCVSVADEEQPATRRPRQLIASSPLAPLAAIPT